ncbi:helix-turn-helix domain-containing protein [soil metagenome]
MPLVLVWLTRFRVGATRCQVFYGAASFRLRPLDDRLAKEIVGVAALAEPVRRSLYLYVSRQPAPVGRDEAARVVGTTRENAAFHLDRLVREGLLATSFRRLTGKTGPGAGRPSKLYSRTERQLDVTVPRRRYRLAAELLARALDEAQREDRMADVGTVANTLGRSMGTAARASAGRPRSRARSLRHAVEVLEENGFQPVQSPRGVVRLRNCPFDPLPREHRELVCGMNLSFIEGVLSGLGADGVQATRDQRPGMCCVVLRIAR